MDCMETEMPIFGQKRKLYKLRKAIENGDFTPIQEEMLKEGEIGKLADAIIRRENERQAALEKTTDADREQGRRLPVGRFLPIF